MLSPKVSEELGRSLIETIVKTKSGSTLYAVRIFFMTVDVGWRGPAIRSHSIVLLQVNKLLNRLVLTYIILTFVAADMVFRACSTLAILGHGVNFAESISH